MKMQNYFFIILLVLGFLVLSGCDVDLQTCSSDSVCSDADKLANCPSCLPQFELRGIEYDIYEDEFFVSAQIVNGRSETVEGNFFRGDITINWVVNGETYEQTYSVDDAEGPKTIEHSIPVVEILSAESYGLDIEFISDMDCFNDECLRSDSNLQFDLSHLFPVCEEGQILEDGECVFESQYPTSVLSYQLVSDNLPLQIGSLVETNNIDDIDFTGDYLDGASHLYMVVVSGDNAQDSYEDLNNTLYTFFEDFTSETREDLTLNDYRTSGTSVLLWLASSDQTENEKMFVLISTEQSGGLVDASDKKDFASEFMEQYYSFEDEPTQPRYELRVTKKGDQESGTVSVSSGEDCDTSCSEVLNEYAKDTVVTLEAEPSSRYEFSGWGGVCEDEPSATCTVTMSESGEVTATFTQRQITISVSVGQGSGTIISSLAGINCGDVCEGSVNLGSGTVSLHAQPDPGYEFLRWTGSSCRHSTSGNVCRVVRSRDQRGIGADFVQVSDEAFELGVKKDGLGSIEIEPGDDCGTSCSEILNEYESGTFVELKAIPKPGHQFSGWAGDCADAGFNPVCSFRITKDRSVRATFEESQSSERSFERADSRCYNPSNVGKIGSWDGCNGMLIVDDHMLFGGVKNARECRGPYPSQCPIGNYEYRFVIYDDNDNMFTFTDDANNIFTGQVQSMAGLFTDAPVISWVTEQLDIGYWDTSSVTDMRGMFYHSNRGMYGSNFVSDMDISGWDVSSVTDMSRMFERARDFNQPLNDWDVSSVTNMWNMFAGASSFNQPLDNWDVSSVTNMGGMFRGASSFDQPLDNWDVSSVTDMAFMFRLATSFNQPLDNWDVSSVTNMGGMFWSARSFDQPLNVWDVSSVENMHSMFRDASSFNRPLNNWDVSSVESINPITGMARMFIGSPFSHNINNWCVQNFQSEPHEFSTHLPNERKPRWGECPPPDSYTLTVIKESGSGSIDVSPGRNCNEDCSRLVQDISYGSVVHLTATPATWLGYSKFDGWGGACNGSEYECTITMDESHTVTARFSR
ncbi:MAG: BspA family leucine-rich repeat surface protein [Candidatus Woesearchaeota archaeon]